MPRYWALVATPKVYRIEDVIRQHDTDTWLAERSRLRSGDRALIWKAKGREDRRGVVAFADVIGDPVIRTAAHPEYFTNDRGREPRLRAGIRYYVPDGLPIWYDPEADPDSPLGQLPCARMPRRGAFLLTPEQWEAVAALVGGLPSSASASGTTAARARPRIRHNPPWARDEWILALDVYLRHRPGPFSADSPFVTELSEVLRALPVHRERPDPARFRNPNGIAMQLAGFLRFDPDYPGAGLTGGGKHQKAIWDEFAGDEPRRVHLRHLAEAIRESAANLRGPMTSAIEMLDDEEDRDVLESPEGRILMKLHKVRERNGPLVRAKKAQIKERDGVLACEVCGFVFARKYGPLGEDFIECHHTKPVSTMVEGEKTRLEDLSLVCSNCHRMLHRGGETLSVAQLRALLLPVKGGDGA